VKKLAEFKVEKKDGSLEEFDQNKLGASMMKAGASDQEATHVAGQVVAWAPSVAVNGVVRANDLRTKVLALLQQVNPEAAATFQAYKKPEVVEAPTEAPTE
jgi:transcriptional regulator NrdR family protein